MEVIENSDIKLVLYPVRLLREGRVLIASEKNDAVSGSLI
jgi:hypothetical protein